MLMPKVSTATRHPPAGVSELLARECPRWVSSLESYGEVPQIGEEVPLPKPARLNLLRHLAQMGRVQSGWLWTGIRRRSWRRCGGRLR
jgi:hypothetical protein